MESPDATLGFRVRSGWAVSVLLAGTAEEPTVVDREVVHLAAPDIPQTMQPYHAGMGHLEEDQEKIRDRLEVIFRVSAKSTHDLLQRCCASGYGVGEAGMVVGSVTDPAAITNMHIRAHALEGRLFRTVLEEALRSLGIPCLVVIEREAYSRAAAVLGRPEQGLKRQVTEMGRVVDGAWRAEDKLATLAAWLAMSKSA